MNQALKLRREVVARRVPEGDAVTLPTGTQVELLQSLGGNFTVDTLEGMMRIDAKDADALGLEGMNAEAPAAAPRPDVPLDRDQVLDVLRTVFDPEIPINVVDLGLIYGCELRPLPAGFRVEIRMSMTAPGCGMGDVLREDVKGKLEVLPGVAESDVEIVWDPPWSTERMSEAAKLEMGWL